MSKISFNDVEYDVESLSDEAKAQFEMLVLTENKLRELQQETVMLQTARNAYAHELQRLLPTALQQAQASETLKF